MNLVPTGWPSIYESTTEQVFASCPTVQDRLKKTPEEIAREHVFNDWALYVTATGELRVKRPVFVLVDSDFRLYRDAMNQDGSQSNLIDGGFDILISDDAVDPGNNDPIHHKESRVAFTNFIGGILEDIDRIALKSSNIGFRDLQRITPFERTPLKERSERQDFWEVTFRWEFVTEP